MSLDALRLRLSTSGNHVEGAIAAYASSGTGEDADDAADLIATGVTRILAIRHGRLGDQW